MRDPNTPVAGDPVEVVPAVTRRWSSRRGGWFADHELAAVAPTQVRRPWRATLRTAVAVVIGFAPLAPVIYEQATQHDPAAATGLAGTALAIAGGVTRVLAIPAIEQLLRRYRVTSWLAAAPAPREEG